MVKSRKHWGAPLKSTCLLRGLMSWCHVCSNAGWLCVCDGPSHWIHSIRIGLRTPGSSGSCGASPAQKVVAGWQRCFLCSTWFPGVFMYWVPSRELTYPPKNCILKMIFLFPRWDMLVPCRVSVFLFNGAHLVTRSHCSRLQALSRLFSPRLSPGRFLIKWEKCHVYQW